jgi:hypothetical protein
MLGGDAGVSVSNDSAGDVTIAGTLADGGIKLTYASGHYNAFSGSSKLWNAGDILTLSAAGSTVPAFSGKTVTAPGNITLTSPSCASFNCGTISRSADLSVTWTGNGPVNAQLFTASAAESVSISCTFPTSPGTVTANAMGKLLPAHTGSLTVSPSSSTTFSAGDYQVSFTANGAGAVGTFTTN